MSLYCEHAGHSVPREWNRLNFGARRLDDGPLK